MEDRKMFEVVYFSRGGNTKKVAEAIAEEIGTKAKNIKTVDAVDGNSVIIMGTGCYGAVLAKDITDFIERNHLQGRKVALFTTSAFGLQKETGIMIEALKSKGLEIIHNFNCFGQFLAIKRGHPDAEDLKKAREFARMVAVTASNKAAEPEPVAV
jgi:flavodoxin